MGFELLFMISYTKVRLSIIMRTPFYLYSTPLKDLVKWKNKKEDSCYVNPLYTPLERHIILFLVFLQHRAIQLRYQQQDAYEKPNKEHQYPNRSIFAFLYFNLHLFLFLINNEGASSERRIDVKRRPYY